ncbi:MAG: CPBP family intramembrane metalloprotease [Clostridia bacterium]|nr:CPBP family intramembrane metalloprotease [Clostridia bacterium]
MSWRNGRAVLCWIGAVISAALGVVGGSLLYAMYWRDTGTALAVYAFNAAQQVFAFALPALLILAARPQRLQAFRRDCFLPGIPAASFSVLLAVSGAVVVSVIASLWAQLLYSATGYTGAEQALPQARSAAQWALALLTVAAIPALCEELFFRGLIQSALCRRLPRVGVWLAAVIFAVLHFRWDAFPALILVGVVLGLGYRRHGYWGSALLHCLYNAVVLLLSDREISLTLGLLITCAVACAFSLRGYLGKENENEVDRSGL